MVYQKSKAVQSLMYMQHRHMECGKLHIWHDLVLDQNVSDNAYSTSLLHEALDVNHKMVILGIGLYHNIYFHVFLCNIIIILNMILSICPFYFTGSFSVFPWSMTPFFWLSLDRCFWDSLSRLTSFFLCARINSNLRIKYFWYW